MPATSTPERSSVIDSFEHEWNSYSSEPDIQPVTPELGRSANWGSPELRIPDTSPGSISASIDNHQRAPVHLGGRRSIGLVTASTPLNAFLVKGVTDNAWDEYVGELS
ncbi:hypothetical protein GQX73_g7087 [Xylaria multiplex]|uniref:Uncharacterized protein n=1 Tax=Xylaria multiplex TaxID=323545 RepID=A0A7C8IL87_9PEZI|nr:hypothetical protein GQX73_g7087 [Xylaria multiplex]